MRGLDGHTAALAYKKHGAAAACSAGVCPLQAHTLRFALLLFEGSVAALLRRSPGSACPSLLPAASTVAWLSLSPAPAQGLFGACGEKSISESVSAGSPFLLGTMYCFYLLFLLPFPGFLAQLPAAQTLDANSR